MKRLGPGPASSRSSLGFAFLYLPIVALVALFLQRLAAGHGLGRLLDPLVRRAAAATSRCSTRPGSACASAVVSATLATVLGTLAALALARHRRFRGRTLFSGMVSRRW